MGLGSNREGAGLQTDAADLDVISFFDKFSSEALIVCGFFLFSWFHVHILLVQESVLSHQSIIRARSNRAAAVCRQPPSILKLIEYCIRSCKKFEIIYFHATEYLCSIWYHTAIRKNYDIFHLQNIVDCMWNPCTTTLVIIWPITTCMYLRYWQLCHIKENLWLDNFQSLSLARSTCMHYFNPSLNDLLRY